MALVNSPNGHVSDITPASDDLNFKEQKRQAALKHRQKIKEARQKDYENALKERDELKQLGVFDRLSQQTKDSILARCVSPSEKPVSAGPSFFRILYGENPKAGDFIMLKDIIAKTYKGMDAMKPAMKKWATKNIFVECQINTADMLSTKYVITKIGGPTV